MLQAAANKPARRLFDIKFIPHETLAHTREVRASYDRL